jgi:hypothetical protein
VRAASLRHLAPGAIVQRAIANPRSLRPAELMTMQRTLGNRAAGTMLGRQPIQAKLIINVPGDQYERDADRMAESNGDGGFAASEDFVRQVQVSRGGGRPLPDALRSHVESALGADFSDVRVHVGGQAQRIGAVAFTMGSDIHIAPERFQPDTAEGRQLLGHELVHVVQQRAGRVRNPLGAGVAVVQDRALEAQADRLGDRAAAPSNTAAVPAWSPARITPPESSGPGSQHVTPGTRGRVPKSALIQRNGRKGGGSQTGTKPDYKERKKKQDEAAEKAREKARQNARKKEAAEEEAARKKKEEAQKKIDARRAEMSAKSATSAASQPVVGRSSPTVLQEPRVTINESALRHLDDGWAAAMCGGADNLTRQTLTDYIRTLAIDVGMREEGPKTFSFGGKKLLNQTTKVESYCSMAYQWYPSQNKFHIFHFGPESATTHFLV